MSFACFECGKPAHAAHHVVPRLLGGKRTLPLCADCHRKIHSAGQTLSLGVLSSLARRRLRWHCEVCDGQIANGKGCLELRYSELSAWRHAEGEFRAKHKGLISGEAWQEMPEDPEWHVVHYQGCDDDPDATSYWIGVDRIRTLEQAFAWTLTIAAKPSFEPALYSWERLIAKATGIMSYMP